MRRIIFIPFSYGTSRFCLVAPIKQTIQSAAANTSIYANQDIPCRIPAP